MKFMKHSSIRKVHFWATLFVMIPLCIITLSGMVLMLKKQLTWVQPSTVRGESKIPTVSFETILDSVKLASEGTVTSWDKISRIDVRPSKGVAKVQLKNSDEIQLDLATGKVLQIAKRRSDLIEDIHTGAYFGDAVKYGLFFTASLVFFVQLISGIYLFFRPFFLKQKRKKLLAEEALAVE